MSSFRMTCMSLPRHGEGHERDHAGALDRDAHLALMARAIARDAPLDDLAAVGDEVLEGLRILVVDPDLLVGAEAANLATREAALARCLCLLLRRRLRRFLVAMRSVFAVHRHRLL